MLAEDLEKTDLMHLLGLENVPDVVQEEVFASAVRAVNLRVFNRILDMIEKESDGEEFVSLLEADDVTGLNRFFKKQKIPIGAIIREESLRFKEEKVAEFGVAS